jgi:hypothetical protein
MKSAESDLISLEALTRNSLCKLSLVALTHTLRALYPFASLM